VVTGLAALERRLADPHLAVALKLPHQTVAQAILTYRLIATGLRARALFWQGHLGAAARALEERRALLETQLQESRRDADLRALTLTLAELAALAQTRGDHQGAATAIARALDHADGLLRLTGAPVSVDLLHILRLGAELDLQAGGKGQSHRLSFDLRRRLEAAHVRVGALKQKRNAFWRSYQRWLEIYLVLGSVGTASRPPGRD
jgi:hypothetical protein